MCQVFMCYVNSTTTKNDIAQHNFLFWIVLMPTFYRASVASTMVYPPNWATLKLPAAGKKLLGRSQVAKNWASFHFSFFFQLDSILSIQKFSEFLILFNNQEHSFHQFQGLRCPGEQSILIIHFTQNSTI